MIGDYDWKKTMDDLDIWFEKIEKRPMAILEDFNIHEAGGGNSVGERIDCYFWDCCEEGCEYSKYTLSELKLIAETFKRNIENLEKTTTSGEYGCKKNIYENYKCFQKKYEKRLIELKKEQKARKQDKKEKGKIYYQQNVKELCTQRLNKNVAGIITSYLF